MNGPLAEVTKNAELEHKRVQMFKCGPDLPGTGLLGSMYSYNKT